MSNDRGRRILVVDDEETLRSGLQIYLEHEGYAVDTAAGAEEALEMDPSCYDLILLDIMMGRMSGTEMARLLKGNRDTAAIPIIFLTAKDRDDDMVKGLRLGADDYIVKPFSMKNVLARIETVLRRYDLTRDNHGEASVKAKPGIECDRRGLMCRVDGTAVRLPKKEFEILALFLEHRGRVFTREELIERIWPDNVVVSDRTIDVHITRIRSKIAPYGKNIISRSGYGYGWQD